MWDWRGSRDKRTMGGMGSLLGALALALLTIAFLPSPDRTATAEPTRAPTAPTVVFLGDAVLGPGPPGCVTCEAVPPLVVDRLERAWGEPVAVLVLAAHDGARMRDWARAVGIPGDPAPWSSAAWVVVSLGLNDLPPYRYADQPCRALDPSGPMGGAWRGHDAVDPAVTHADSTCARVASRGFGAQAVRVLDAVRRWAPDARVVVLTPYSSWVHRPALGGADAVTNAAVEAWVEPLVVRARRALEAAGARVGAACVDLERMIGDVRGQAMTRHRGPRNPANHGRIMGS